MRKSMHVCSCGLNATRICTRMYRTGEVEMQRGDGSSFWASLHATRMEHHFHQQCWTVVVVRARFRAAAAGVCRGRAC